MSTLPEMPMAFHHCPEYLHVERKVLELIFVFLAVDDVLPVVEVLVVFAFEVEVRHAGGVVPYHIDVLGRDGGRD